LVTLAQLALHPFNKLVIPQIDLSFGQIRFRGFDHQMMMIPIKQYAWQRQRYAGGAFTDVYRLTPTSGANLWDKALSMLEGRRESEGRG
jgi:hypothetical protein